MKLNHTLRWLVLSATLFTSAFAAQSSKTSEIDSLVSLYSEPTVMRGMTRETVVSMIGAPDVKLSPEYWVYWDFTAKGAPRGDMNDTLLVGFTAGRVTLLQLCRSEPVRAFIAQQEARALKTNIGPK